MGGAVHLARAVKIVWHGIFGFLKGRGRSDYICGAKSEDDETYCVGPCTSIFHVHMYPRNRASLYLAGRAAEKMELTRCCLLCWRCCLLVFLYFTNTIHSVHGLSE